MRYIIGLLLGIGFIILLFVLIFRHGSAPATPPINLVNYANTSTIVQYTDDYPVNADQNHNVTSTTVGRDETTLNVYQGYQGTLIRTQSYNNNPTAYANFLRALQGVGFTTAKNDPALADERGVCPLGHRYIFEIKDGNRIVQRLWSTSCGNIGNFKGRTTTIITLFHRQVPDFSKLTTGLESNL
jgi:hypothetical protein